MKKITIESKKNSGRERHEEWSLHVVSLGHGLLYNNCVKMSFLLWKLEKGVDLKSKIRYALNSAI